MTGQGDHEKRSGTLGSDSSEHQQSDMHDEGKSARSHTARILTGDSEPLRDLTQCRHHATRAEHSEVSAVMRRNFHTTAADMQRVVELLAKHD